MITAANREGHARANVSAVIAEAGVSRPTFYEYFRDRDACFVATVLDVHERLLDDVRQALAAGAPDQALTDAIRATVAFAGSHPPDARFLMNEALAGGPAALNARDQGIQNTAKAIEDASKGLDVDALAPDVPVAAVIGSVHRVLATRLRRGERALGGLADDLQAWVERYRQPMRAHRWGVLEPLQAPERSPYLAPAALRAPPPLGPGRPRLSEEEVAENHRQRIMFATSQVVQEHGYSAATIAQITRTAGVDGRAFYRHFKDKQEAFSAIHELGFQYLMAASAGAFFAGATWPERIWEAFRAALGSIDETPAFADVAFVEAYAVGPGAIQRVEDSRVAFTIFLQEGYRHQGTADTHPSRPALEAIVTTIFEIVYLQARASADPKTAGLLAPVVYVCLTPFIGAQTAGEFLVKKEREMPGAGKATPRPGNARRSKPAGAAAAKRPPKRRSTG